MTFPLQITFRHMPASRIFENRIRELARRLERFSAHIISCQVVIQAPHQHQQQGTLFDVHINLTVPDRVIAIQRTHAGAPSHADPYVSLRDSFSAAKRKLQEYEQERRRPIRMPAMASG